MVAERLLDLRSPTAFSSNSPVSARTMAAIASSPGEEFVQSGVQNLQIVEVKIGDVIFNIGLVSAAGLVGAAGRAEAKELVVEKLIKAFGKYQDTSAIQENSDLSDIQQNDLDDTPAQPLQDEISKQQNIRQR